MPDPHQEQHLLDALRQVVLLERRLGHAGEGGELVDHPLDVVDLPDDRIGALIENVAPFRDDASVAPLQALGRELDRCQRVLDLVGDAPGDVGPGRRALRRDEVGDVVERHDVALVRAPRGFGRDPDVEVAFPSAAHERDLRLIHAVARHLGLDQHGGELGKLLGKGLAHSALLVLVQSEQLSRERVQHGDDVRGRDADHRRWDARQHGFREHAAFVEHPAGFD